MYIKIIRIVRARKDILHNISKVGSINTCFSLSLYTNYKQTNINNIYAYDYALVSEILELDFEMLIKICL